MEAKEGEGYRPSGGALSCRPLHAQADRSGWCFRRWRRWCWHLRVAVRSIEICCCAGIWSSMPTAFATTKFPARPTMAAVAINARSWADPQENPSRDLLRPSRAMLGFTPCPRSPSSPSQAAPTWPTWTLRRPSGTCTSMNHGRNAAALRASKRFLHRT